jgi:hypothetical protein
MWPPWVKAKRGLQTAVALAYLNEMLAVPGIET